MLTLGTAGYDLPYNRWWVIRMGLPHSPADLERIYTKRFAGQSEYRQQVWRVLVAYFARWIPRNSTVLDLGCGYCEFINQVEATKKYAMDLNPEVVNRAAPEVQILQQDCSEPWGIPADALAGCGKTK